MQLLKSFLVKNYFFINYFFQESGNFLRIIMCCQLFAHFAGCLVSMAIMVSLKEGKIIDIHNYQENCHEYKMWNSTIMTPLTSCLLSLIFSCCVTSRTSNNVCNLLLVLSVTFITVSVKYLIVESNSKATFYGEDNEERTEETDFICWKENWKNHCCFWAIFSSLLSFMIDKFIEKC